MTDRIITTLGKANKALLREELGIKSINEAKRIFGVDTADEAYEIMKDNHNELVEKERQDKVKQSKAKKDAERKADQEALKRKVVVYPMNKGVGSFVSLLKTYRGKNIVCDVIVDGERVNSIKINVNNNFYNWWEASGKYIFVYPEDTGIFGIYPNGKIYIYEGEEFSPKQMKKITQVFKDADNGKCVFNPIREWANAKYEDAIEKKNKSTKSRYGIILEHIDELEEKYPSGVNENNIDEVCNTLQIDISVEKPLCDEKFIVCKSIKKALKHFRYLNTRLNHVDLNEYVMDERPTIVSRKELIKMKQKLTENGTYHTFNKDLTNISKIQTLNGVYSVSNEMNECFSQFEIDTGLLNCKIDDIDDPMLSSFIKWGTHYNGTIDFKEIHEGEEVVDEYEDEETGIKHNSYTYELKYDLEKVHHIDMSKAYSKFKMCKFYEGFLGKITDFRLTKTVQGVGLYYIYDLVIPEGILSKYNDTLKIYQSHNIYTSFELKFLETKGCSFKILSGCWGVQPLDFDFSSEMLDGKNDDGNSYYALWTGKCDSHYLEKKTWINGDYDMCCLISENTTAKIEHFENNEICVKYDKKHNYHLGHITAFITAYQRLNVLEQLEAIDYDNIIRVCVDGIYTEKPVSDLKNAFRHKNEMEDKTFANRAGECFISNIIEDMEIGNHIYKACGTELTDFKETIMAWRFGEERKSNAKELHVGAGGNGKTHKNLVDKGLVRLIYVSPSWKLARNKQAEYGCKVSVWARIITEDPEMITFIKRYSNVLLIDECSMMTEQQKLKIFEVYWDMKIIFCGDIGFQLGACEYDECVGCNKAVKNRYCYKCKSSEVNHIVPEQIKKTGFDAVIENNTNYRCKDIRLLELYKDLRMMIDYVRPVYEINDYVIEFFMKHNRIINRETLRNMYEVNDMILVGTNEVKDEYTEMFKHLEKYYCKENNRVYSNGDIIIGEKPDCVSDIRHAYTTHSIQGETAQHKLFIDADKMFDAKMFYTAISRAKVLEQVFIIE